MKVTKLTVDADGNQVILIPRNLAFNEIGDVTITKDGECLIITPLRKSWSSFADVQRADEDFLDSRQDVFDVGKYGR